VYAAGGGRLATLWLLSVRRVAEETILVSTQLDVTATLERQRQSWRATRLHLVSIVHRGWITILLALLDHAPLQRGPGSHNPGLRFLQVTFVL
jgi:hypothetical protein